MEKLAMSNPYSSARIARSDICAVIGMAAFWMSAFKRLLYPVMFTYYRTGNEAAVSAQGVYAAIMALCALALVAGGPKLRGALAAHRWAPACMGLAGAAGMVILSAPHAAVPNDELALIGASALVALYLPVHLAFWLLYAHEMRQSGAWSRAHTWRNIGASVALFAIAFIALSFTGLQNSYVSVACPVLSSVMMIACPATYSRAGSGNGRQIAGARPSDDEDSEPASAAPASAPSVASAPAPSSIPTASATVDKPLPSSADTAPGPTASANGALPATISTQRSRKPATPSAEAAQTAASPSAEIPDTPSLLDPAVSQFADDFDLSDREAELAAYTYRNYSARKIAGQLFIAESTVYTHQKRIYRKTGVHSKAELIELIDAWKQEQGRQ